MKNETWYERIVLIEQMKSRIGSKGFRIALAALGLLLLFYGTLCLLGMKQNRDKAAVREYINRVQPMLEVDPRFKDVRLAGYSCDFVLSHICRFLEQYNRKRTGISSITLSKLQSHRFTHRW